MCLIGFDSDPLDAKKRSAILQKRRYQTLVSGLVALKGMYKNIVCVDRNIVREDRYGVMNTVKEDKYVDTNIVRESKDKLGTESSRRRERRVKRGEETKEQDMKG